MWPDSLRTATAGKSRHEDDDLQVRRLSAVEYVDMDQSVSTSKRYECKSPSRSTVAKFRTLHERLHTI